VMGGDFAPREILEGAKLALDEFPELYLYLVGKEEVLAKADFPESRVKCIYASQVVSMDEPPSEAIRKKRDSSILKGLALLKEGEADAFVSAGNSGAVAGGALFTLGRIKGVRRPAIATLLPSMKKPFVLIDAGANVDSKPVDLFQFGIMGKIFLEKVWNYDNPKIALLSIGEETGKGNSLVKKTHHLFSQSNFNYTGNVESKDIYKGEVDVVVCDGFIGNICLKLSEGVAEVVMEMLKEEVKKSFFAKLGMALASRALKAFKKRTDWREYGGAPLLGVKGVVIIAHGRSDRIAIKNAVKVALNSIKIGLIDKLETAIQENLIKEERE